MSRRLRTIADETYRAAGSGIPALTRKAAALTMTADPGLPPPRARVPAVGRGEGTGGLR